MLLILLLLNSETLPPSQNVVGPNALIVGFTGLASTTTVVGKELTVQPFVSVKVAK